MAKTTLTSNFNSVYNSYRTYTRQTTSKDIVASSKCIQTRTDKGRRLIPNAKLVLCISCFLPLVISTLGPVSASQFGVRKKLVHGNLFTGLTKLHASDRNPCKFFAIRGGNADFVGDDEPWKNRRPDEEIQQYQQLPRQSGETVQSQSTKNAYGSGAPWQQNNRQPYPPNQQSWGGSQPHDLEINPSTVNDSQDGSRNKGEPYFPESSGRPIYGVNPQQNPMQRGYPGQQSTNRQQRGPQSQGMYPPPPHLPVNGEQIRQGARMNPSHPSMRVQNAHVSSSRGPPGFEDEEEDDWLPSGDNIHNEGENGLNLSANKQQGVSDGGGMDLSQFDKDLIFGGLKRLYRKKIRPLELSSKYGHFHSPPLSPSDFDAKPMVLLVGQYSVGKTSFIRYLLGRDFPGQRIGPEVSYPVLSLPALSCSNHPGNKFNYFMNMQHSLQLIVSLQSSRVNLGTKSFLAQRYARRLIDLSAVCLHLVITFSVDLRESKWILPF